jgi:hypothetical protein
LQRKKEQPRKMAALFFFASFPVFTRSLAAFGVACASARPQNSVALRFAVFASTATLLFGGCSTASHQPEKERLKAEFNYLLRYRFTFSVAVTRTQSLRSPRSSSAPSPVVAVSDRNTATRSQKKAPCKHRFFLLTWGVSSTS